MYVLDYDDREPAGPMLVGPFATTAEADSWHDAQHLQSASYSVRPVANPRES